MNLSDYRSELDPHRDLMIPPPQPCTHGHGGRCDCQLPHYKGLFVVPINCSDNKLRTVIARMRMTHDGGMREFTDPLHGNMVGCCGMNFAFAHVKTLEEWMEMYRS